MSSNASDVGPADDRGTAVSVSRLYREMVGGTAGEDAGSIEQRSEAVLESVTDSLFEDEAFDFEESVVKANLDEILLLLVAMRDSETHGKGLMEDLETVFDAELSPGTVYPRLHELEEDGSLRVQELVRTKEYRIDDEARCRDRVESAMRQHLALGFFFRAALDEL